MNSINHSFFAYSIFYWSRSHHLDGCILSKNENLTLRIFAIKFSILDIGNDFFSMKTIKHLDIRRDMKNFSPG